MDLDEISRKLEILGSLLPEQSALIAAHNNLNAHVAALTGEIETLQQRVATLEGRLREAEV